MRLSIRLRSLWFVLFPAILAAQPNPEMQARMTALESATRNAQSAGDNAWMLVSAALVLMMTGPGLALFYGGLVRRKNVLGTMMQSFILMAVVTVLWAVVGYSLAFGGASPFVGDLQLRLPEQRGQRAQSRLRRHHSAADLHDLPVDVRHHHAGADLRRLRRAHEVQRHAAVHRAVEPVRLLPHGAHGVGQGRSAERVFRRQDSVLRFRRRHGGAHHLRRFGAGVRALSGQAPRLSGAAHASRTTWCSASSAPACCGWAGSDSTRAARWRRPAWPPAPSWPRTSAPPRRRSAGWRRNGCTTASPACWAASRVRWRAWWPSRRLRASSSRFRRCSSGSAPASVCYLMVTRGQGQVRLRRFAGRVRRARGGRNAGRAAHRRVRHQRGQRRFEGRRRARLPLGLVDGHAGRC